MAQKDSGKRYIEAGDSGFWLLDNTAYRYRIEFFANRTLRSQDGDWLSWAVPDLENAGQWLHGNIISDSQGLGTRNNRFIFALDATGWSTQSA
ncbi:hypothetical protein RSAG8_03550, partial [Rhizoctonia solani AG-8 WAC10335]